MHCTELLGAGASSGQRLRHGLEHRVLRRRSAGRRRRRGRRCHAAPHRHRRIRSSYCLHSLDECGRARNNAFLRHLPRGACAGGNGGRRGETRHPESHGGCRTRRWRSRDTGADRGGLERTMHGGDRHCRSDHHPQCRVRRAGRMPFHGAGLHDHGDHQSGHRRRHSARPARNRGRTGLHAHRSPVQSRCCAFARAIASSSRRRPAHAGAPGRG